MDRTPAFLALLLLSSASACTEPSSAPALPGASAIELLAEAPCPAAPDFVVRSEAEFAAALVAAAPGAVIAVDGLFEVGTEITIATDDVTLTCATDGSGLRARPDAGIVRMIIVTGRRVTVERLVLDGRGAAGGPYRAFDNDLTGFAEQPQLLHNRVACGTGPGFEGGCALFDGTQGAVVADNYFESAGSLSGVHMQVFPDFFPNLIGNINGSRILRNTVVATGPSPFVSVYGGLRIRDGIDVVIADNVVTGPWSNSVSIANIADGVIERNRLEGAQSYGLRMVKDAFVDIPTARDVVRNNMVAGGSDGLLVSDAVNVQIVANTLEGASGDAVDLFGADGVEFLNNTVQCGSGACLLADGSPQVLIADNYFESGGSFSGVHLQNGTDADRIERNTIVATAPSTDPNFGGLRIRDGRDVVVSDNIVRGPWKNSLALANLARSAVERNLFEGAELYGIRFPAVSPERPVSMTDNTFRDNTVRRSGSAGMLIRHACGNAFLGNDLAGNGRTLAAIFEETTGANVLVLLSNLVVIDNAFPLDCNGDGLGDPNIITGPGRVRRGVPLGISPTGTEGTTRLR